MQKILIVSSKNLLLQPFEGAQKRILDISRFLSKKNQVDLVCIGENILKKKNDLKYFNHFKVFRTNFVSKIVNMISALLRLEPLQNGYFFYDPSIALIILNIYNSGIRNTSPKGN